MTYFAISLPEVSFVYILHLEDLEFHFDLHRAAAQVLGHLKLRVVGWKAAWVGIRKVYQIL
jgi:hypothetical protein